MWTKKKGIYTFFESFKLEPIQRNHIVICARKGIVEADLKLPTTKDRAEKLRGGISTT